MGKIYNFSLIDNFLKEVAIFIIKNIKAKEIAGYTVVLPNNRSVRALKWCFSQLTEGDKVLVLPRLVSISDDIKFDSHKITMIIVSILRARDTHIPLNTIFEMATSISNLIKEVIINDVNFSDIGDLIPTNLTEYWQPTTTILEQCIRHPKIVEAVEFAREHIAAVLNSVRDGRQKTVAVGIGNTNQYTKKLMKAIYSSDDGIIFTLGDVGSGNESYNREILSECVNSIQLIVGKPQNVTRCIAEFSSISEEAQAIAFAVRERIGERILIVSSNTELNMRIKTELSRWNTIPDDSYGVDFSKTPAGISVALILDAIFSGFQVSKTLQVFKSSRAHSKQAIIFENVLKRHQDFFSNFFEAVDSINEEDITDLKNCVDHFREELVQRNMLTFEASKRDFLQWTDLICSLLSVIDSEYATQFYDIVKNYSKYSDLLLPMTYGEYAIFLKKHCLNASIRHSLGYTDGVLLMGAIEAQLLDADFVIIANANEDSFSSSTNENFWFSTSMMKSLGIPTAENKNRFNQCIFERLANKANVLITRSEKIKGVQQIKYSMLDEIKNLKNESCLNAFLKTKNSVTETVQIELPSPKPDVAYRPTKFSVTDLEQLKDNPYGFYAKKILQLPELQELDEIRNLRGNFIHNVLDIFVKRGKDADIYKISDEIIQKMHLTPSQFGLWFFQMQNIFEFVQKNKCEHSFSEVWGSANLDISGQCSCRIFCKADRLDFIGNNSALIIDYKTTSAKISKKDVECGKKIQLPIEGWIFAQHGFDSVQYANIVSLQYWFLGKKNEKVFITSDCETTNAIIDATIEKIKWLIKQYNVDQLPYTVNISYGFDEKYMHLARLDEWFNAR